MIPWLNTDWRRFLLVLFPMGLFASLTFAEAPVERGEPERKVRAFVYVGQFSDTRFNEIVRFDTDFQSSWVGVLGVARELASLGPYLKIEGEVQLGQHWGMQSHQEVNGLFAARWTRFPWDEIVPTSAAFGSGLSFAFERPPIEGRPTQPAERLLKYLMVELEVSRARQPDWSLFFRIHHRSGVFGYLSDARGSNFVGLGLRTRF